MTTIHGRGYRQLEWQPEPTWRRLWPIAFYEFRSLFKTKWGVVLFIAAQIPTLKALVELLLASNAWSVGGPEAQARMATLFDPTSAGFYSYPVDPTISLPWFLVITTLVSSRAVAKDRAANAFEIYWTRGITPVGYFLAKWVGSIIVLGCSFVVGPLLVWIMALALMPDLPGEPSVFASTIEFMPATLVGLILFTAVLTGLAVGLSAIVRTPNFGSMVWLFVVMGSAAITTALLQEFVDAGWLRAFSPWHAGTRLFEWITGAVPRRDYDPLWAVGTLGVAGAWLTYLLSRRLRVTEAVQ